MSTGSGWVGLDEDQDLYVGDGVVGVIGLCVRVIQVHHQRATLPGF